MPDPWFPGAIRDPGRQAGYRSGRCRADVDVAHETVGTDSRALIRNSGLAWILFPKVGPPIQFAPCDATTAHACEWNTGGAGHEVERIPGEPLTADQVHWIGEVVRWRHEVWGVVLDHHPKENGRLPIGSGWRGTADHGGLVHRKCDQHTDGWSAAEWAAITGGTSSIGDDMAGVLVNAKEDGAAIFTLNPATNTITWIPNPDNLALQQAFGVFHVGLVDQTVHSYPKAQLLGYTLIGASPPGWTFPSRISGGGGAAGPAGPPGPAAAITDADIAKIVKAVNDDQAKRLAQ